MKTRPVSPESLVVTKRPPSTTSPLDSTIAGSSKRNTSSRRRVARPHRGPDHERDGEQRPEDEAGYASVNSSARRGWTPQAATSSSYSCRAAPPGSGRAGPHGAQQGVARGVLALHELHHVDAVALRRSSEARSRVGQGVGEPLAEDAVPGQHGRTAPARGPCAAGPRCRGGSRARPAPAGPPTRPPGRAPRRSRCHRRAARAPPRAARASSASRMPPTTKSTSSRCRPARPRRRCASRDCSRTSTPIGAHRQPAHRRQVAVRGERQVGVAAAEVDHPQRLARAVGRRRCPGRDRVGDEASMMRRNSSTWRYFACRLGFIRPCWSESPSATNTGSSSGSSRALSRSCSAVDGDLLGPVGGVHHRLALLGDPQLVGLAHRVDVPVAERLVEQRVDGRRRLVGRVVGRVRLGLVVRRHLEVPAGLQVDVAQLHPAPPRAAPRRRPEPTARTRASGSSTAAQRGQHATGAGQRLGSSPRPPRGRRPAAPRPGRPG